MSDQSDIEIITEILTAARYATVTTRSHGDALHSRPLAVVQDDFTGTLWFFTADPSPKTSDIAQHPEVNVAVGDDKGHLSMSGTASVDRDPATIDKYWNPWAEAWFEGGREDPTVALLRVDVDTVELWDMNKPGIAKAFELVKGIITRTPPNVGESRTVEV
ncbi:pyridoxamine 5'-phosphate oxidase family protein [soil metagenome]